MNRRKFLASGAALAVAPAISAAPVAPDTSYVGAYVMPPANLLSRYPPHYHFDDFMRVWDEAFLELGRDDTKEKSGEC